MVTESPQKAQITLLAKQLKLSTLSGYSKIVQQMTTQSGYEEFLLEVLKNEVAQRQENQQRRRIKTASFPYTKTLDEFDYSRLKYVQDAFIWELASCQYIKKRENVIMVGGPGNGKTHLSIGLGLRACKEGFHVKFITAAALVNMLSEAKESYKLGRIEKSLQKYDLLILDELSYLSFNRYQSELLFQVITERSERGSVIVTTNLEFSEWTELFENEKLIAAMIDRLTFRSHILNMNGDSYRLTERQKVKIPS